MKTNKTLINNLKHGAKQLKAHAKACKEAAERIADLEKIAEYYRTQFEEKTRELEALKAEREREAVREAVKPNPEKEAAE